MADPKSTIKNLNDRIVMRITPLDMIQMSLVTSPGEWLVGSCIGQACERKIRSRLTEPVEFDHYQVGFDHGMFVVEIVKKLPG